MKNERLLHEAKAFDMQIIERVENGHIPDLRRAQFCNYFYNNAWRHPEYVKLDMGDKFETILSGLKKYLAREKQVYNVLEVGCGPGYISLELARNGYNTVGIDISPECISVAKEFADKDPWKSERALLEYYCEDFLNTDKFANKRFDAVIFLGTLHHFEDQEGVMNKVSSLLDANGIILVHEPTRDRVTKGNVAFMGLIQVLLSVGKGYYKNIPIPDDSDSYEKQISMLLSELTYVNQDGEKIQSINDNDSGFQEMFGSLNKKFYQLEFENRYAFFREIIGGLRFEEKENILLAKFLKNTDKKLVELGVLQPTEFFFVGTKR